MAINCKVLYKTVCRLTQKKVEVPKHFMGFLRTLVTAATICVFGVACCHQFNGATERNQITKFI